jgi:hypothetical protein
MRNANEKLAEQASLRRQKLPWLPQSLEQEAVRELGHMPGSRKDFALLQKRKMRAARRGGYKSWALRNTVHALQRCAAAWNKNLIWTDGRAPPKRLLKFLVEVLRAAKINHPNPKTNSSKFIALMLAPKNGAPLEQAEPKQVEYPPEPSEVKRRLAKMYL